MSEAIDNDFEYTNSFYAEKYKLGLIEEYSLKSHNNILYIEINNTEISGPKVKSIRLIKPLNAEIFACIWISTTNKSREELTNLALKIMEEVTVEENK